jgi:hypothetical protein
VSALFHYLGPSFAVLLFARVDVLGVAWLRIASAALILAAWRRPWRALATLDADGRRLLLAWGAVLALMSVCFYSAITRLPLGTVAAVEFLPVVILAAAGVRSLRNLLALALAVPGVYLLTGVRLALEPAGIAVAVANAILFALYIVLADRVAKRPQLGGIDGLAAVVVTPIAGRQAAPAAAGSRRAAGRRRRRRRVVGDPVRHRPARDGAPAARDLRAHGGAAARDRDDRRDRRARAGPEPARGGGRRARRRRRGAAPQPPGASADPRGQRFGLPAGGRSATVACREDRPSIGGRRGS